MLKLKLLIILIFVSNKTNSQDLGQQISNLVDDAVWYSDKYITPATDGAVYMASSGWMNSPKKRKLFSFDVSIHANAFIVPNRDSKFDIKNSDFKFFEIHDATSATVPSALGNEDFVYLKGTLNGSLVWLKTPEGINQEFAAYSYLKSSIALWYGTEIIVKYSPKIKINKGEYQVYGFGIQHNIDQYFKKLIDKKINFAALAIYSSEEIQNSFVTIDTPYGNLGINTLIGKIDTYQFQINASKEFKKFEIMGGVLFNVSDFKYFVGGDKGTSEISINGLNFQDYYNLRLKEAYKTKTNFIGEVSCRYNLYKGLYAQSVFGFGKFINGNFSVQYQF